VSLGHPDEARQARIAWEKATRAKRSFECEYRWHALRAVPEYDCGGKVLTWIFAATDIDDQRQFEARLRRGRRKSAENIALLDTLYPKSPVGLGFVDGKFRIVRINEALASINGASVEEHNGQRVADVVSKLWPQIEPLYGSVLESFLPIVNREVLEAMSVVVEPDREVVAPSCCAKTAGSRPVRSPF
jgi:PAS domain-containing protein